MSSGTVEEDADRALASVAKKLEKSLSVESTINALIAEATDPVNIATIFYGEYFHGRSYAHRITYIWLLGWSPYY